MVTARLIWCCLRCCDFPTRARLQATEAVQKGQTALHNAKTACAMTHVFDLQPGPVVRRYRNTTQGWVRLTWAAAETPQTVSGAVF
jgi:hypothetical protein